MNDVSKIRQDRFRTMAGVLVLLVRRGKKGPECLLQKRRNTGFADGMWDFSTSGHVDKNEPMTAAVCREAREEIGAIIAPEDVKFVGLYHMLGIDNEPRLLGCFVVDKFSGKIAVTEPETVEEVAWFAMDNLPGDIINSRKWVIERYLEGETFYHEFGWNGPEL